MAGRGEPKGESTTSWRWDNVESFIPSEGQNGRRSRDGDHALAARGASVLGVLKGRFSFSGQRYAECRIRTSEYPRLAQVNMGKAGLTQPLDPWHHRLR
jgi:hypothetical protein